MARTAELASIETRANGVVAVMFTDGLGIDFPSKRDLLAFARSVEVDPDIAKKLLMAWWLARDANMSNTNLVLGKALTFDSTAQNMITVK